MEDLQQKGRSRVLFFPPDALHQSGARMATTRQDTRRRALLFTRRAIAINRHRLLKILPVPKSPHEHA